MTDGNPCIPAPDPDDPWRAECFHARCCPAFDEVEAGGLGAMEVRRRWPRFRGICPDCGCSVIAYASFRHYLAGNW